jgi:mono/diheme cytochrome c family protein
MIRIDMSRLGGLLLLCATVAGCALLDPSPEAEVSGPARDRTCDSVASKGGAEIYLCKCIGCHGIGGVAPKNGVRDIDIYADTASFQQFDAILTSGPGTMPRYPDLDSAARRRLYEQMKTFR